MTLTAESLSLSDPKKKLFIPREDFERWIRLNNWTFHQLARGEFPPGYTSFKEFQLAGICADPVLWSRAFLRDPDNPDDPWEFWDYQKESIRYPGDTLHECGAEVGKTREIIAYILWKMATTPRGSGLVTAPMLVHALEIIDALLEQLALNREFKGALAVHRKHPHHHMKFSNGFKLDFRPTGHDGEALRGVHVRTFAIMDEAVKAKNPDIFKEFWRATKPGCVTKLYSTPDGDRSSIFYRLCKDAEGGGSTDSIEEEDPDDVQIGKDIIFKKFHWGKSLMPAPFWTPERRRSYIKKYGGEDSPGYCHNVKGEWGDPENSVFPWFQFERLLKDIPEYRCLKILVDKSAGEVAVSGMRYTIGDANSENGNNKPAERYLIDKAVRIGAFDIRSEIKAFFSHVPGLVFGGADLGFSQDPTEIYVKLIFGRVQRLIARVRLKGVTYDEQAEAIDAVDDVFDAGERKMGWGIDFGNAGSAVTHILQGQDRYFDKRYEERLTGYQFGAAYDAVNEEGDVILNKYTQKPVRLLAKELATDILVGKMQRQELEYPYDPDLILYYPNHTYRQGPVHRIYKKEDDHVIDADRALMMRVLMPGDVMEDIFASGN